MTASSALDRKDAGLSSAAGIEVRSTMIAVAFEPGDQRRASICRGKLLGHGQDFVNHALGARKVVKQIGAPPPCPDHAATIAKPRQRA
jgi:hypothetical protein